jgi:hypothetical protein
MTVAIVCIWFEGAQQSLVGWQLSLQCSNIERWVEPLRTLGWWSDSNDRAPAWQVPGPEFKPRTTKKEKRKKKWGLVEGG